MNNTLHTMLLGASIAAVSSIAFADDFAGDWGLESWTDSGIDEGVTSIVALPEAVLCSYDNGPGPVAPWEGTYAVTASADGTIGFDWEYTGFHAWHMSFAGLQAFADGPEGTTVIDLVEYVDSPSSFSYEGSATLVVHEGYDFGVIVAGENFDSSGSFHGSVLIDEFWACHDGVQIGAGGDYAADQWGTATDSDATMSIESPLDVIAEAARLCYDVDLGSPGSGVSYREASFTVPTGSDGTVEFDWSWSGFHAWHQSYGALRLEVDGPDGTEVIDLQAYHDIPAVFNYDGSVEIDIHAGYSFSIIVGGENFDSNSQIRGCIELTDFDFDAPVKDTCPEDVNNDGAVDVGDLLALLAAWGICP